MATTVGYPTLTMNNWSPPDKSGYMEQISQRAPSLIAPADKVLYAGLEHRPVVGYQYDWLTDDLAPIAIPAGLPFENEPNYATQLFRNRLNNVIKLFMKTWSISEYAEIIAKNGGISSGIVSEVSRQIMLKLRELSREIERNIASGMTATLENAPGGQAYSEMGGYFGQITSGNASLGKVNTIDNFVIGAGQSMATSLGETAFQDKIAQLYTNGAGDLHFVSTPAMMMTIGRTWVGRSNARETLERSGHKVDSVVERYAAPVGGEVTLEPDRSIGDCGLLYDAEQVAIGVADEVRVFRADPGSFMNLHGRIRTYLTLITGNPQASGGWTTSATPDAAGD